MPSVSLQVDARRPKSRAKHKDKTNGHAKLQDQIDAWLERSLLTAKELPGCALPKQDARTIEFYDVHGVRQPAWDITRRFDPTHGFRLLTADADRERPPKYLAAEGQPPHLYWPRTYRKPWLPWAQDKKQRKLFYEGPAKAACATKLGFPGPSIQGCWAWRALTHGLLYLPELVDIQMAEADVYWIPDWDTKPKSRRDVRRATRMMAYIFREYLGCTRFHVVYLPQLEGYEKTGVDDYLHYYSVGGDNLKSAVRMFGELLDKAPVFEDYDFTEPDDSRLWVDDYGDDFRYVGRKWMVYRRGVWSEDGLLEQQETLKRMYDRMLLDARSSGNAELATLIHQNVTAVRVEHVIKLNRSHPKVAATSEQFDTHACWVNCKNGVLELPERVNGKAAGELRFRAHSSADMLTRQANVDYDAKATCPTFDAAMDFWTQGDQQLSRLVLQLLGMSITGITQEQLFIILYGDTQTGKSTLLETVAFILANYFAPLNAEDLLVRRYGKPEERKLAPLVGVRLATASETEKHGHVDENLIKLLTGEDSVQARNLYSEPFYFMPQAKIWLRTNHPPDVRSTDNSFWRRVIVVPFGHVVTEKQKNVNLRQQLRKERHGVFRRLVEGYLDYVQNGLAACQRVEDEKARYRKEQDVLARFFDEKCEMGVDPLTQKPYNIGRELLYLAYVNWCDAGGQTRVKMSNAEFKEQILTRFKASIREGKVLVSSKPKRQEHRWIGITTRFHLGTDGRRERF